MKYVALAVLLAVMQAPPPVPRQTPNNHASQSSEYHRKADTQRKEAAPPASPVSTLDGTPKSDSKTNPAAPSNAEEPIRVRELPSVTLRTDGWTKGYVLLTGCLVLVGIGGVYFARRSLLAIESQLGKMEQQITEMQKAGGQTQEIIARMKDTAEMELRAYVCISTANIAFIERRAPEVQVKVRNSGKTPAYDVKMWIGIGHGPYPPPGTLPPPPQGFQMSSSILGPGEEPHAMTRQYPAFSREAMRIIGTPQLTLYIQGRITYRDAFKNERCTEYRLIFGGIEPHRLRNENRVGVAFLRVDTEGNNAT